MARRNRRTSPDLPTDSDQPIIARVMIRVSDVRGRDQQAHQGREFLSPEMQLNAAKALCQVHGWTFDEETSWRLRDLDQSASRKTWQQRPGMAQHVADAKAGAYNVLIFYSLSRFARNVSEGLELWKIFDKAKVSLFFSKESIDTSTAAGRMVRTVLLAFAQMQAEQIAEYSEDAHVMRANSGKAAPSLPHWLKRDGAQIIVLEEKAQALRRLVDLRLEMAGTRTIAKTLNAEGHRAPSGKPWSQAMVIMYLESTNLERLGGVAIYSVKSGDVRLENAYPAIVPPEKVAAAIAIGERLRSHAYPNASWKTYHDSTKTRGMSLETKYLVSSLFRCAYCGGAMNSSGSETTRRTYICLRGRDNPLEHEGGTGTAFMAEPVEDATARVVRLVLTDATIRKPNGKAGKNGKATKIEKTALASEEQADVIRGRMRLLLNLLFDEKIDRKVYDERYAALEVELAEVLSGTDSDSDDGIDPDAALSQAKDALSGGAWRAAFIHLVERVDGPVFLEGVESTATSRPGRRYTTGIMRRCIRVTLRFPIHVGGKSRQVFIAPLYRAIYTGERQIFGADGEPLDVPPEVLPATTPTAQPTKP